VPLDWRQGFDRLSPNGVGFVFGAFVFPMILSLSKDKLSPNGVGFVFHSKKTHSKRGDGLKRFDDLQVFALRTKCVLRLPERVGSRTR
jgi:hypothetical protein